MSSILLLLVALACVLSALASSSSSSIRSSRSSSSKKSSKHVKVAEESYSGPWRTSLVGEGACWTDRTCDRALSVSHGGDWDLAYPYDSLPAFQRAAQIGSDAVKGDFRVTKDNIGMVMHSSPIEAYESINCAFKKVEEMTADQCKKCKMAVSDYFFISAPELLSWADGISNVMFCVKEERDIARAITTLIENNATERAFLELKLGAMQNTFNNKLPFWDEVYYVVELHNSDEVQTLLNSDPRLLSRTFLLEFNDWDTWPNVEDDIKLVESKGFRSFAPTKDSPVMATYDNHMKIFNLGFDAVYTYNLTNAVEARVDVNTERGLTPP